MGIPCGINTVRRICADLLRHPADDRLRLLRSQRSIDEIILHVHNHQYLFHTLSSIFKSCSISESSFSVSSSSFSASFSTRPSFLKRSRK